MKATRALLRFRCIALAPHARRGERKRKATQWLALFLPFSLLLFIPLLDENSALTAGGQEARQGELGPRAWHSFGAPLLVPDTRALVSLSLRSSSVGPVLCTPTIRRRGPRHRPASLLSSAFSFFVCGGSHRVILTRFIQCQAVPCSQNKESTELTRLYNDLSETSWPLSSFLVSSLSSLGPPAPRHRHVIPIRLPVTIGITYAIATFCLPSLSQRASSGAFGCAKLFVGVIAVR